jgi:hypothetical protein
MKHHGSCHCGKIAYDVEGDIGTVVQCNCSHCQRKGYMLWFVPRQTLTLNTPGADMRTYKFNRHVIEHHFCAVCGCAPFADGKDAKGNATAAVNVRCLEGVDLSSITVTAYDGRSK